MPYLEIFMEGDCLSRKRGGGDQMPDYEDFTIEGEMQNIINTTGQLLSAWPEKLALGAALSSVATFFSADIVLYYTFLAMNLADFVLGVSIGLRRDHILNLGMLGKGIKKFLTFNIYILLSGVASMTVARIGFETGAPLLTNLFIGYLILHEMISVIRNMEILGFNSPPLLKKFLRRTSQKIENTVSRESNNQESGLHDEKSENSPFEHERGRDLR